MIEKPKIKKGFISEEDISLLLQRYTATTILALLREVAQFAAVKIDWDALVKNSSTGISNTREYQMLWRHLAYRDTLVGKLEDGAEPLDDDSDLEYELETSPPVSREASTEAAACVKVLIASGLPSDSGLLNSSTVEAPLTINIPSGQASRALSDNLLPSCTTQGMNITVPVLVQKQPLPTVTSAERLDANGPASSGFPPRRKRKLWTEEEDNQLIAAVKKCGERSWANMLKGDFKGDRTASQLSQRWANLRKRQNLGGVANSRGSQLSEAQLATRRAVSLALHMPMVACSVSTAATYTNTTSGSSALPTAQAEASQVSVTPSEMSAKSAVGSSISQAQYQSQDSQQIPTPTTASSRTGTSTTPKSQKKTSSVPVTSLSPDPMIQAAAVAAGARIATHSTAASLLKAAQSKSAFHIRPGGSLMKTSMPGGTKPWVPNHVGPHPNVHYIRTGLATPPPPPTFSGVMPSVSPRPGGIQQAHASSVRPAVPTGQVLQASAVTSANLSAQQTMSASSIYVIPSGTAEGKSNNVISTLGMVELSSREEVKPAEEMKENGSGDVPKEHVQDDQAARANSETFSENHLVIVVESISNAETCENSETAVVSNQSVDSQNESEKMASSPWREGSQNQFLVKETGENQSVTEKQRDMQSMVISWNGENHTVVRTEVTGNETGSEMEMD